MIANWASLTNFEKETFMAFIYDLVQVGIEICPHMAALAPVVQRSTDL
jgi:hypothetical protein